MNKDQYLEDENVAGFINWLRSVIVANQPFQQAIIPRNGRANHLVNLTSFQDAVRSYDFSGQDISATQDELNELAEGIQLAMHDDGGQLDSGQQQTLLIACLKALVWGGVTVEVTIGWLADRAQAGALDAAISTGTNALLSESFEGLEVFRSTALVRSDSAATKLYALADGRSIIYDNRVGAAFAKLVCEYLNHMDIQEMPESLAFMVKRDKSGRRDPSLVPERVFEPKVPGYKHAVWNQRGNWIIGTLVEFEDVVQSMSIFDNVGPVRAIESALFVMGDDVRGLIVNPVERLANSTIVETPQGRDDNLIPETIGGRLVNRYCVPTSHNFGRVMQAFHTFREQHPGSNDLAALAEYFVVSMNVSRKTARCYAYPLIPQQFDLANAPDDLIQCLAAEPLSDMAFRWLQGAWRIWQHHHTEYLQKIMICTWCLGYLYSQELTGSQDQAQALVDRGLAGNFGGAQVMISVGRSFGQHFGLLDPDGAPTDRFRALFD